MHQHSLLLSAILFATIFLFQTVPGEDSFFRKAAKNVPRIGRNEGSGDSKKNADDMWKFLMKASKSVPRIGRTNDELKPHSVHSRDQLATWSDLANRFEYEPEYFTSPEILERLEMGDDPVAYDWDTFRMKRSGAQKLSKFNRLFE